MGTSGSASSRIGRRLQMMVDLQLLSQLPLVQAQQPSDKDNLHPRPMQG